MAIHIGIDPGKSGFVVALQDGSVTAVPTPVVKGKKSKRYYDVPGMWRLLSALKRRGQGEVMLAALERQQAFPGSGPRCPKCSQRKSQGATSTFQTGFGYGLWTGLLAAAEIPTRLVSPRTWQKDMLRGTAGTDTKARSIMAAMGLFPGLELKRTARCRKADPNKADALLLAAYARDVLVGVASPAGDEDDEEEPSPTSPMRQFTDLFCDRWAAKYGRKYPFAGAKDGKMASLIWDAVEKDMEAATRLVDAYMAEDGAFFEGHPLTKLWGDLARFLTRSQPRPGAGSAKPMGRRIREYLEQRRRT